MKIVITVVGKDRIGIVADTSAICKALKINILDISQKVFDGMFSMVMIVTMEEDSAPFPEIAAEFEKFGEESGLKIHTMHEDIFNSMHRI